MISYKIGYNIIYILQLFFMKNVRDFIFMFGWEYESFYMEDQFYGVFCLICVVGSSFERESGQRDLLIYSVVLWQTCMLSEGTFNKCLKRE